MHDKARRRQDDAPYRFFFRKVANRLKSQGFDNPSTPVPAHGLEFHATYPWVHYRAEFLPELREARVSVVIDNRDAARNWRLFDFILEDKRNIESELGELIWERELNGESHISVRLPNCTIDDTTKALEEVEEWFVQTLRDFARVFWRQLPTKPAWSFVRNWSHKRWSYEPDCTVHAVITLEEWWEPDQDRVGVGIVIRTAYRGRYEGTDTEQEAHASAVRREALATLTQRRASIESELGPLHWGILYTDHSYRVCAYLHDRTCFDDDATIAATRRCTDNAIEEFKRVFKQIAEMIGLHEP